MATARTKKTRNARTPPAAKTAKVAAKRHSAKTARRKPSTKAPAKPVKLASIASTALPMPASKSDTAQQIVKVARQLRSWSDSAIGLVAPVADMSLKLATTKMKSSGNPASVRKAGALIDKAREAAGLTVQDVTQAVNLRDKDLLEQAEGGKVRLSFEVILRLASVYGRHDPLSFIMKIARASNPELWKTMENIGVGKLAVQSAREREFVNIYRSSDEARKLNETEFAAVLSLVNAAFEMALAFMHTVNSKKNTEKPAAD